MTDANDLNRLAETMLNKSEAITKHVGENQRLGLAIYAFMLALEHPSATAETLNATGEGFLHTIQVQREPDDEEARTARLRRLLPQQ